VSTTSTDVEGSSYEYEYEDARLATEKHGRACSLDSARVSPRNDIQLASTLTEDQRRVVEAATDQLTTEQQERIAIRQENVAPREEDNEPETALMTLMAHLVHLGMTTAVNTLLLLDLTVVSNTIVEAISDDPRRDLVEV
jgi:hypothetical protein